MIFLYNLILWLSLDVMSSCGTAVSWHQTYDWEPFRILLLETTPGKKGVEWSKTGDVATLPGRTLDISVMGNCIKLILIRLQGFQQLHGPQPIEFDLPLLRSYSWPGTGEAGP